VGWQQCCRPRRTAVRATLTERKPTAKYACCGLMPVWIGKGMREGHKGQESPRASAERSPHTLLCHFIFED
jgi:hypothetical protein